MGVRQVLRELLADVVGLQPPERSFHCPVERTGEALGHRPFLRRDLAGHLRGVGVPGLLRHALQQVVRGEFHVLVGEAVRDELARGVRLRACEQDEGQPCHVARQIFGANRVDVSHAVAGPGVGE